MAVEEHRLMKGKDLFDEVPSAAITDPTGGATVDAEARTAIVAILGFLRAAGLIST